MKNKWKAICDQLIKADTEFDNFLDNGGLTSISLNRSEKLRKEFNALKKAAADFDKYISPVEIEIKFPFHTTEMTEMWERWKNYLSEQHGELIRTNSEQCALEHLAKISKGDEAKAVEFLRYAMACRYRNFFAIDEKASSQPAREEKPGKGSAYG